MLVVLVVTVVVVITAVVVATVVVVIVVVVFSATFQIPTEQFLFLVSAMYVIFFIFINRIKIFYFTK